MKKDPDYFILLKFVNSTVLPRGKERYDQGDKSMILHCLFHCFMGQAQIPPWLAEAFLNAYDAKREYKIKSWDEVFGRPLKKGIRPERERRNRRIANDIYERVRERHSAGEPIEKSLFEAVGKDFGVGGTVASELYYWVREIDDIFREDLGRVIGSNFGGSPENDRTRKYRVQWLKGSRPPYIRRGVA